MKYLLPGICLLVYAMHAQLRACIVCEQGPDGKLAAEWARQKHKTTQVVDAAGKPLAGVRVFLEEAWVPLSTADNSTSASYTSGPGLFSYRADSASSQVLVFAKQGYASIAHRVAETLPRQIILPTEKVLTGTVVLSSGAPVVGAKVGPLRIPDPARDHAAGAVPPPVFPYISVHTDERGQFTISGLQDGAYHFNIETTNACAVVVNARSGDALKIVVHDEGTTVSGVVASSRTGQFTSNTVVEARSGELSLYAASDAKGRFAFTRLAPQDWKLRVYQADTPLAQPDVDVDLTRARATPHEVELTHNLGVDVIGVAVDAVSSSPIANLELTIEGGGVQHCTTDAAGRFQAVGMDGASAVFIRFGKSRAAVEDGRIADNVRLEPAAPSEFTSVTLALHQRARVEGTVHGPDGSPSTNCMVQLRRLHNLDSRETVDDTAVSQETDVQGKFLFYVYPYGEFRVEAVAPGLVSNSARVLGVPNSPGMCSLRLDYGRNISGHVRNTRAEPVGFAQVEAFSRDGVSTECVGRVVTNAEGKFEFQALPQRANMLRAYRSNIGTRAERMLESHADDVELIMPAGRSFVVNVLNDSGSAIPQAMAELSYQAPSKRDTLCSKTTTEGIALFGDLPVDSISRLAVRSLEYLPYEATDVAVTVTTHVVELKRGAVVRVSVSEDALTSAAEVAQVMLYPAVETSSPLSSTKNKGEYVFRPLSAGNYRVGLRVGDSYTEGDAFTLAAGEQKRITISPGGRSVLQGLAVTDLEAPVEGALVSIHPRRSELTDLRARQTVTAADGTFTFTDLWSGDAIVDVRPTNYPATKQMVQLRAGTDTHTRIIVPSKFAGLSGRATYTGKALPNTLVVLTAASDSEKPYLSQLTEPDGSFKFSQVQPGSYLVTAEAPISDDENVGRRSYEVDLKPGSIIPLEIAFLKPAQVNGSVAIASPGSTALQVVFVPESTGGATQTAPLRQGKFSLQLEPGRYRASVDDGPAKLVNVPPSYDKPLEIQLTQ